MFVTFTEEETKKFVEANPFLSFAAPALVARDDRDHGDGKPARWMIIVASEKGGDFQHVDCPIGWDFSPVFSALEDVGRGDR